MATELIDEIDVLNGKLKQLLRRLREHLTAAGSGLLGVFGVGPAGAARILADVGDITRFANRNRFASWTGTAPIDASSGEQIRHRLSRAGNRRINHVLYIAAIVQIRHDTEGRTYYRKKIAEGKTPLEALRCLRRRLSDVVYRQLVADATTPLAGSQEQAGPGGHTGATLHSSAANPTPNGQLFGQATSRTRTHHATATLPAAGHDPVAKILTQKGARSGRPIRISAPLRYL